MLHNIRSIESTGEISEPDTDILSNISLIIAGVSAQAIAAQRDDLLELEHPDEASGYATQRESTYRSRICRTEI